MTEAHADTYVSIGAQNYFCNYFCASFMCVCGFVPSPAPATIYLVCAWRSKLDARRATRGSQQPPDKGITVPVLWIETQAGAGVTCQGDVAGERPSQDSDPGRAAELWCRPLCGLVPSPRPERGGGRGPPGAPDDTHGPCPPGPVPAVSDNRVPFPRLATTCRPWAPSFEPWVPGPTRTRIKTWSFGAMPSSSGCSSGIFMGPVRPAGSGACSGAPVLGSGKPAAGGGGPGVPWAARPPTLLSGPRPSSLPSGPWLQCGELRPVS